MVGPGSELRFTTFLNRTVSYEEASGSSGAGYRYTPDLRHIDRALAAYGLRSAKPVAAPGVKDGGTKLANALDELPAAAAKL